MAENRKLTPTTLLILLAVASFAAAAVTITNITEWHVQSAGTPPIVKVAGADVNGSLLSVSTYTNTQDGTNRTVITIKGYTGDPTYYSEAIKICNKDTTKTYSVKLVYKGLLGGNFTYVQYLKLWLGSAGPLTITSSTAQDGSVYIGPVNVGPNSCVSVPAEVLVKPGAPTGSDLVSVEVDVVSTG
jgi:hypothetical protein